MVHKWYNVKYEIVLLLIKGKTHVRGLAHALKMSHSTVLRKLNELVKENILDYQTEGKNKVFYLRKNLQSQAFVFSAEHYKLTKLLRIYPELEVIIEELLKKTSNRMVILFGSHAKFIAKHDSDIDIYVETKNRKLKDKLEDIHSKLSVKIGSFDPDADLVKEIIKNHVILKNVEEFYEKIKFFKGSE